MQIIWRKESEMTIEEKRKLDLIRVLAILQGNVDLGHHDKKWNMGELSKLFQWADVIMEFFDIKHAKKDMEKDFYPEDFTVFPGHPKYEQVMADHDEYKRASMVSNLRKNRHRINALLDQLVNKKKYVNPDPSETYGTYKSNETDAPPVAFKPLEDERLPKDWKEMPVSDDEQRAIKESAEEMMDEGAAPTMGHALDEAKKKHILSLIDIQTPDEGDKKNAEKRKGKSVKKESNKKEQKA